MVVIESERTLGCAAALAKALVDDPGVVQLLVPARLSKRLSDVERERRDSLARKKAEVTKSTFKVSKPRLDHKQVIEFNGSDELIARARELNIDIAHHGRTAGARDGPHDWRHPGARLALRIKENGYDNVRSAKVFTRVLASAIVACNAQALAELNRVSDGQKA